MIYQNQTTEDSVAAETVIDRLLSLPWANGEKRTLFLPYLGREETLLARYERAGWTISIEGDSVTFSRF